eukprot:768377-Hanusia_phi.AAC.2
MLYLAFFASGIGPVPWTVNSEIYPLAVRSQANSVATVANWTTGGLLFVSLIPHCGQPYRLAGGLVRISDTA